MLGCVHGGRPGEGAAVRVELAEADPDQQLAADGAVDVGHGDQAAVHRFGDGGGGERAIAVLIGEAVKARAQGGGVRRRIVVEVVLGPHEVRGGPCVASGQQLIVGPLTDETQQRADVRGPAVDEVSGGHDPGRRARLDRLAERREVVLVQHARAQRGGRQVAELLVVVTQEVLEGGGGQQVAILILAGQAPAERGGQPRGEQRVLG